MVDFVNVNLPRELAEITLMGELKSFAYNYANDTLVYLADFNKADDDINININIFKINEEKDIEKANQIFPLMSPLALGFKMADVDNIQKMLDLDSDMLGKLEKIIKDVYEIMDRATPICDPVAVPIYSTSTTGTNPKEEDVNPYHFDRPAGTHEETDEEGNTRIVVDGANLAGFKTVTVDGKELLIPKDVEDVADYLNKLKEARERGML